MGDPPEHALPAGVDSLLEHEILKAALDAAEVGYAFESCQSGAITVSPVFQKMLGMAEDTFVTSIETLAALAASAIEVDGPDLAAARAKAVESGQRHTLNARFRCADGLSTILLRIAVRPVRGPSGDIASIVYFAWDVTESPELRAALTRERFAYQQAQKLARVGHFVVDAESGEVLTSPVLAELLGLEPADGPIAMDDLLKRVMTPEEIAESGRRRDTLMATEEAYDVEIDIHAADSGESRILAVRMEPIFDETGAISERIGVAQDITRFRQAERELADRESMLLRAERMGQLGHFRNDFARRELHLSPMIYEMFGLEAGVDEDRLGTYRLASVLPAAVIAEFEANGRAAVAERASGYGHTLRFVRRRDGSQRVVHVETTFDYENDKLVAAFGLARDVTEIAHYQSVLEFREQFYAQAQKIAQLAHWRYDYTSRETLWSDGMYAILGLANAHDDLTGLERLTLVLGARESARFSAGLANTLKQRVPSFTMQVSVLRQTDGARREIRIEATVEYDASGRALVIFGIIQDITDQLAAGRERRRLQRIVADANRSESLNFFAGGLAHELSNMLQPALSFGDLTEQAIKRGDDDKALQYLTSVLAAIDRARTLTRQMLGFVALPPDDVAPIPVAEALNPAQAILGVVARTITWTVPDELATVSVTADSTGVMQILLNIVRNAINAGGEATAIDIRVAALDAEAGKPAMIAISVTDDGPGIEPDDLVKIFEPRFTRRAAHYSAGLGLPIARSIAERWGGGLDAESAPGQGRHVPYPPLRRLTVEYK